MQIEGHIFMNLKPNTEVECMSSAVQAVCNKKKQKFQHVKVIWNNSQDEHITLSTDYITSPKQKNM